MRLPSNRLFVSIILACCILLFLPSCSAGSTPIPTNTIESTASPTFPQPTVVIQTQTPYIITATPQVTNDKLVTKDVFFLSCKEGGYYHLFAYSPQNIPLVRLTADAWDDITPSISPDGKQLAFSSRRNGYWDLYLLDLGTGEINRLTDTLEYDAAPTWSPDGAVIAYESYSDGDLNIFIRSVSDKDQAPIQLTKNESTNTSPAWSPLGRTIAFVSNRSGKPEIWIADLDHAGAFVNISNNPRSIPSNPAWSPDGSKLAWASTDMDSGITGIYVWEALSPDEQPHWIGSGDWPAWLDDNNLVTRLSTPNQTLITGYSMGGVNNIPPVLLPGSLNGLSIGVTTENFTGLFQVAAAVTQPVLFDPGKRLQSNGTPARLTLMPLANVTAAFPKLVEGAANSFEEFRTMVSSQIGWDALGNLENAFIPLTTPPDPGMGEDWLYTGRAFTLNPVLVQADWMVVVREDFGQQVYWRIYLRTRAQDGSQGMPLSQVPWDFSARSLSSSAYENGGQLMGSIPAGYWFDLTTLAVQYGWQRLPALTNWRTYYAGARFSELVFSQDLDWRTAMLQLYPPEILVTPTMVIPPTRTPTRTPLWYVPPTPPGHQQFDRPPLLSHETFFEFTAYFGGSFSGCLLFSSSSADFQTPFNLRNHQLLHRRQALLPLLVTTVSSPATPASISVSKTPSPLPTDTISPMQLFFPTVIPAKGAEYRPPLYPTPWALSPYDHFYFAAPIAAAYPGDPIWDYRYGGIFFGPDVIHTGVDLPAPRGAEVLAAGPGTVVWAGYGLYSGSSYNLKDPYGLAVAIRHDFGYKDQQLYTRYMPIWKKWM